MARQNLYMHPGESNPFVGRPRTARRLSWRKEEWIGGCLHDTTPRAGNTYTRETWPPRGRGRGESLYSIRRVHAKLRAIEVFRLRIQDKTWQHIADTLGYRTASGAYRAYKRMNDRMDWDNDRAYQQWKEDMGLTDADVTRLRAMLEDGDDD